MRMKSSDKFAHWQMERFEPTQIPKSVGSWIRGDATISDTQNQTALDNAPNSLFAAIQKQLGLKLENGKGAVEFLIVDGIARSSEN
jgi:uncharacterized protein (TIGR03435 family)